LLSRRQQVPSDTQPLPFRAKPVTEQRLRFPESQPTQRFQPLLRNHLFVALLRQFNRRTSIMLIRRRSARTLRAERLPCAYSTVAFSRVSDSGDTPYAGSPWRIWIPITDG